MSLVNTRKRPDKRRVTPTMGVLAAIEAVSDGLIGNVVWLVELVTTQPPPPNMLGMSIGHLISIDDMGVYGESLWHLFKGVLSSNINDFVAMSNALQEGSVSAAEIRENVRLYIEGKPSACRNTKSSHPTP